MSKRRILNITSTKKRDELPYFDPATPTNRALTITSSTTPFETGVYIFCPTAREQTGSNEVTDRNSTTPFYRGYAETMTINATTSAPWRWRRIVFSTRSLRPSESLSFTSNGYARVMAAYGDAATFSQLFKGANGVDWTDIIDAKVDPNRARVMYDRVRTLRSGAAQHQHFYKIWHPMNKTLHYDEDETGATETTSPWSTTGTRGLGDVFILDLFQCSIFATGHSLIIKPQGSLYWHEK